VKAPRQFPVVVRTGSVGVKIYRADREKDGSEYTSYTLSCTAADGRRKLKAFAAYGEAYEEAKAVSLKLAQLSSMRFGWFACSIPPQEQRSQLQDGGTGNLRRWPAHPLTSYYRRIERGHLKTGWPKEGTKPENEEPAGKPETVEWSPINERAMLETMDESFNRPVWELPPTSGKVRAEMLLFTGWLDKQKGRSVCVELVWNRFPWAFHVGFAFKL